MAAEREIEARASAPTAVEPIRQAVAGELKSAIRRVRFEHVTGWTFAGGRNLSHHDRAALNPSPAESCSRVSGSPSQTAGF
jgi:hypothetical protein